MSMPIKYAIVFPAFPGPSALLSSGFPVPYDGGGAAYRTSQTSADPVWLSLYRGGGVVKEGAAGIVGTALRRNL